MTKKQHKKDEDILELTEVVEDLPSGKTSDELKDVLSYIDQALKNNDEPSKVAIDDAQIAPTEFHAAHVNDDEPIDEDALLSETQAKASSEAIKQLMNVVPKQEQNPTAKDITLEALVMEATKPLLKEWLDLHLPDIVEALVEKEIRKIVPNT